MYNAVNWSKSDFHFLNSFEKRAGNVETMVSNILARVKGCQVRSSDDKKTLPAAQHAGFRHIVERGSSVQDLPSQDVALM